MTIATLKPPVYSLQPKLKPPASLLKPALVLNRNWQPINVATVARALIMLWNDSAKIVDPIDFQLYDWSDWSRLVPDRNEPFIQSVRQGTDGLGSSGSQDGSTGTAYEPEHFAATRGF